MADSVWVENTLAEPIPVRMVDGNLADQTINTVISRNSSGDTVKVETTNSTTGKKLTENISYLTV